MVKNVSPKYREFAHVARASQDAVARNLATAFLNFDTQPVDGGPHPMQLPEDEDEADDEGPLQGRHEHRLGLRHALLPQGAEEWKVSLR